MAFCAAKQNGPPYDTLHISSGFNVYTARWNGTTWDSIRNVGRRINPASYPTVSPGGETLFVYKGNKIWMSVWQDTGWSDPIRLPYPVNDPIQSVMDGPCAISIDGRQLYFKSTRSGGYGSGDIWVVRITASIIDSLTNLGPNVNSNDMETHPAISPDGQRLYFSDFGGSRSGWKFGDCDLYVSHWNGSGWDPAQILAAPVNTDLPCCSAFETADGNLYLGSEVSEGTYGEEDIWVSFRTEKNRYQDFDRESPRGWQNTSELTGATFIYDLIEKNNDGSTWSELIQLPYARAVRKIFQKSDGIIFAGTSPDSNQLGRVWRSTNNGSSWQRTGNLPLTAGGIFCFTEVGGGGILTGGRTQGDKYYVSLNNGNIWNVQNLPYVDSSVTIGHLYFFYRTSDGRLWTGGWAQRTTRFTPPFNK